MGYKFMFASLEVNFVSDIQSDILNITNQMFY